MADVTERAGLSTIPVRAQVWAGRIILTAIAGLIFVLIRRSASGDAFADVEGGYVFAAGLAFWAWHLCRQSGVRLMDIAARAPADRSQWGWVVLALPLLAFSVTAVVGSYFLLSFIAPSFVETVLLAPDAPSILAGRPVLLILDGVAAVLLGPIAEELLFRGALLLRFSSRWGRPRGLAASALLFGILHADPIGAIVFAVFMSLIYWRTGSLLVPMACHVLHNGIIRAGEFISPASSAGDTLAEFRGYALGMTLAFPLMAIALAIAVRPLTRPLMAADSAVAAA
jgi:uncharacterized protein